MKIYNTNKVPVVLLSKEDKKENATGHMNPHLPGGWVWLSDGCSCPEISSPESGYEWLKGRVREFGLNTYERVLENQEYWSI